MGNLTMNQTSPTVPSSGPKQTLDTKSTKLNKKLTTPTRKLTRPKPKPKPNSVNHSDTSFATLSGKSGDLSRLSVHLSPGSNWGDSIITQTLEKMDSKDTVVDAVTKNSDFRPPSDKKGITPDHSPTFPPQLDSELFTSNLTTPVMPVTIPEESPDATDEITHQEERSEPHPSTAAPPEPLPEFRDRNSSSDSGNVSSPLNDVASGPLSDSAYSTIAPMFTEEPVPLVTDSVPPSVVEKSLCLPATGRWTDVHHLVTKANSRYSGKGLPNHGTTGQSVADAAALLRSIHATPLNLRPSPSLTSIRSQPAIRSGYFDAVLPAQIRPTQSQTDLTEPVEQPPSSPDSAVVVLPARRNTYSAPSSRPRRKAHGSRGKQRILKRVAPRSGNHVNLTNSNPAKYGTNVGEGHDNYALMYNMLTGIRVSVSRCTAKPKRPLAKEDFLAANKLAFDGTGNELTPSSKYDFKFKDYAPSVFRSIRDLFGIDPAEYLLSLTLKYILSELSTPGKSGSFFYYSQDFRFIIKTVHHNEHKFFRKILAGYYNHVQANPDTLISRIYGLHRVKMHHTTKIHFVVMANLFPPTKDIHAQFDLKGSTFGRYFDVAAASSAKLPPVLKDLNWLEEHRKLMLGPSKRSVLFRQLRNDVDFLAQHNIMDYSLLLGVHNLQRGNRDKLRQATLSLYDGSSLQNQGGSHDDPEGLGVGTVSPSGPHRLPSTVGEDRLQCVFYSDGGGFLATTENDTAGDELYCMGIIDIMTPYTVGKRIEHLVKSVGKDPSTISAVDPHSYAHRFLTFITRALAHHEDLDPQLVEYAASHPTRYRPKQD